MKFLVYVIIVCWSTFKPNAYPASTSLRLKLVHLLFLLIIGTEGHFGASSFWWFAGNTSELMLALQLKSTLFGDPIKTLIEALFGLAGLPVVIACLLLASRQKKGLKFFWASWSLLFCVETARIIVNNLPTMIFFLWIAFYIASIVFYTRKSVLKQLFGTDADSQQIGSSLTNE